MIDNLHISANAKVLIWARESIAITRTQATERTGISAKRLIQIEEEKKPGTLDELKKFSKAYKRTIATLLLTEPPKEKPLPADRRTINSTMLGIFHKKTIMAVRKARALALSYIELKNEMGVSIPKRDFSATLDTAPSTAAHKFRKLLNLSELREITNLNYALEAYIERVESIGIAVFQLSLTQDGLRGFSLTDEAIPVIGIKRGGEPATAKIFTLFHELGHIILNEGGLCDLSEKTDVEIEKWCNAFSASVLIPTAELFLNMITLYSKQFGKKLKT